ncbi:MAG: cytochrome c biogenesis protein CcsA [Armatimonadota bacterium]|nr:cytochrome c biogenesis protein CcsA [bacterium]
MKITPDNFPIYIALACALTSFVAYCVLSIGQRRRPMVRLAVWSRGLYCASVIVVAYAVMYLLQQILSDARYDIAYINDYSGPADALIYKISSLWAGQEGSLLLWAFLAGLIGLVLAYGKRSASPAVMAFLVSVQSFFLILLIKSDPFRALADYQPGTVGLGLNPLLKNPWMVIHPPVIFLGYAALCVPAACAVAALINGDPKGWAKTCLPWTLFGWVSLSAGIVLGMVWSYEVLGWGGYWGWDPVENASLVPWLTGTALLHGLLLQRYRGRATRGNIILAIATFLLIIYATFLTRSGVLSNYSVHSFADLGAYGILLAFLLAYTILCIGLLAARWKAIAVRTPAIIPASRDFIISIGMIVLILFAIVVLAGTSYPMFAKSGLAPSFYTKMSAPIAIAVVLLIGASSFVGWSRRGKERATFGFRPSVHHVGAYIAHAGVVLMIAGVVLSSSGKSTSVTLSRGGRPKYALGYRFNYAGTKRVGETREITNLWITTPRGIERAAPLAVEYTQRGAVRSPFIKSSVAGDLYISPGEAQGTEVIPVASMTNRGWAAIPAKIPGTNATLTLIGMQVEYHLVRLDYDSGVGQPVEIIVSRGKPAEIDGYIFTFQRFVSDPGGDAGMMSAGAQLGVGGHGLAEKVTVEVSTKPYIWLLWLGTILIILGGLSALIVRGRNGLLSNSNGSD